MKVFILVLTLLVSCKEIEHSNKIMQSKEQFLTDKADYEKNAELLYQKDLDGISSEGAIAETYENKSNQSKRYRLQVYNETNQSELNYYFLSENKLLITDELIRYKQPFYVKGLEVLDTVRKEYYFQNHKLRFATENNQNLNIDTLNVSVIETTYSEVFTEAFNQQLKSNK